MLPPFFFPPRLTSPRMVAGLRTARPPGNLPGGLFPERAAATCPRRPPDPRVSVAATMTVAVPCCANVMLSGAVAPNATLAIVCMPASLASTSQNRDSRKPASSSPHTPPLQATRSATQRSAAPLPTGPPAESRQARRTPIFESEHRWRDVVSTPGRSIPGMLIIRQPGCTRGPSRCGRGVQDRLPRRSCAGRLRKATDRQTLFVMLQRGEE